MLKNGLFLCALIGLSACADPLRDVPRISEVDLSDAEPVAQALPTEAEIAREGFFGTQASIDGLLTAPPAAVPRNRGFFAALRDALPTPQSEVRAEGQNVKTPEETQTSDVIESSAPDAVDEEVEVAALSPEPATELPGFLDRLTRTAAPAPRSGIDAMDVAYGTVLPYGKVARVCDARRKPMGRKVENASARGYKLFDSKPGTSGARTYYITGFADDCPRQLTAAHVVLGAPSFYELLHYGPTGAHLVTGETDHAYEKVKRRVCGVRKGKPCGAKMKTLERNTFFVNAYERLDDNTRWSELLVHDGAVVAASLKTN